MAPSASRLDSILSTSGKQPQRASSPKLSSYCYCDAMSASGLCTVPPKGRSHHTPTSAAFLSALLGGATGCVEPPWSLR
eukprot:6189430-Pleurochrysis_carterae.AAC.4